MRMSCRINATGVIISERVGAPFDIVELVFSYSDPRYYGAGLWLDDLRQFNLPRNWIAV